VKEREDYDNVRGKREIFTKREEREEIDERERSKTAIVNDIRPVFPYLAYSFDL
jgi:hypothetical protein